MGAKLLQKQSLYAPFDQSVCFLMLPILSADRN